LWRGGLKTKSGLISIWMPTTSMGFLHFAFRLLSQARLQH